MFAGKRWSIYGAQRAQLVAIGRAWTSLENGQIKPIGNRWQPTATVSERMVRRGSTVRVRQRALQKTGRALFVHDDVPVRPAQTAACQSGRGLFVVRVRGVKRPPGTLENTTPKDPLLLR